MKNSISFEQAKSEPELRQQYLDSIMPQCPESVESIVYDPVREHRNSYVGELVKEGHFNRFRFELSKIFMLFPMLGIFILKFPSNMNNSCGFDITFRLNTFRDLQKNQLTQINYTKVLN